MRVQVEALVPPVMCAEFVCEVCDKAFATERGLSVHQTRQGHRKRESKTVKVTAKTKRKKVKDTTQV